MCEEVLIQVITCQKGCLHQFDSCSTDNIFVQIIVILLSHTKFDCSCKLTYFFVQNIDVRIPIVPRNTQNMYNTVKMENFARTFLGNSVNRHICHLKIHD